MFNSVTSWLGGTVPPDSPTQSRKTADEKNGVETSPDSSKSDDAVKTPTEEMSPDGENASQTLEDVSVKAYDTAKAWGSYLYSVSKVATETVAKTAMQLKDKVEETAPLISDFTKEQKKFRDENREAKRQGEAAVPPWVGYNEEKVMKEQILALSLDRRNFLRNPPAGVPFHFDFTVLNPVAIATLQEDPNLSKMRFDLVPKFTSEENFWRNYFYRVSLIKQSTQLTSLAQQTGTTGESETSRRSSDETSQKGDSSSSGSSDFDKLSDINELAANVKEARRIDGLENVDTPLGSPPEHEFASDAFQDNTVNEDDVRKELEQMRITNQPEQTHQKTSPPGEEIPEWERELQQELQDYDMMNDDNEGLDDPDIESEILKQLEQEAGLDTWRPRHHVITNTW